MFHSLLKHTKSVFVMLDYRHCNVVSSGKE